MTKMKFCGIKRAEDVEAVNEIKPDYIGFVFLETRKRYVNPDTASSLKKKLDPAIKAVGVFVDAPLEEVEKLLLDGTIDMAQLHGNESEEYISELKSKTDKKIIKAFEISDGTKADDIEKCCADYVLLDSGKGTGKTFNWDLIKGIKRDFFLAGGMGTDNVKEAIEAVEPFAVDVSSGIETDGIKDKDKMAAFAAAVRGAKND
ncbi:MAG: phosphoribosylanthranilate isomerase [Lachnospiraceae bacterium]|nr:phosphoribosylanthranilate isomerase [Lachnospiraceae bacterium]